MSNSTPRFSPSRLLPIAACAFAICAAAPAAGGTGVNVINADGQAIVVPAGSSLQHWSKLTRPGMSGAKFTDKISDRKSVV